MVRMKMSANFGLDSVFCSIEDVVGLMDSFLDLSGGLKGTPPPSDNDTSPTYLS
jgi:hypothetical protein